ncbi:MAG: hypothetical protein HYU52_08745 [Acidobacteria bacterium]|nr:hypothetical protein [Acidobacteriota bacterium]
MNDEPRGTRNGEQSSEPVSGPIDDGAIPPETTPPLAEGSELGATARDDGDAVAESSWRPADYYASPRRAPMFPRWIPLTCGVVAIVALGGMVAVGAFLRSGGLAKFVAIAFGQANAEAARMFDADVEAPARKAFSNSLLAVRDGIAEGEISLSSAVPVLQELQAATRDGKLSAKEVGELTATFEKSLAAPAPAAVPAEPPVLDL